MVTSIIEDIELEKIYIPEQPTYYGQVNAFVLEIFAMKQKMKLRESRNFIEAAFESFPDLEYCAILLPSNHVFIPLLHHFMVRSISFQRYKELYYDRVHFSTWRSECLRSATKIIQ